MGFASLQHFKDRRSTSHEPCHSPLRSALRVWLPSRRLTPSEPVPVLFHTGSAHGIHPSELSPLERYPPLSRSDAPTCRSQPPVIPPPQRRAGPTDRGFWVLTLPRVPGDRAGISTLATGGSLGFRPPRVFQPKPCPGFRPDSSHTLCPTDLSASPAGVPESQSASAWSVPPHPASRMTRIEQPLQGSDTCYAPDHSRELPPGL